MIIQPAIWILSILDKDLEEIIQSLYRAAEEHRFCRISLEGEAFPRLIHVYGICLTSKNKLILVCWQEKGFTKSGGAVGYRHLDVTKIIKVEPLINRFHLRGDFTPKNERYKEWLFHIK